jgi:ABC-type antimicrobial peptide transport system permease subunit
MSQAFRDLHLKLCVEPMTLDSWISLNLITPRIAAGFVAILSGLGLLLAVIGLFGAISYSVSERKKELGIRVALGAVSWQLLKLILRETAIVAGSGIVVGMLLGIAATVLTQAELYGVAAVEWMVLLPVGLGMLVLSLTVAAISARPWLAVDPMEAVRHA